MRRWISKPVLMTVLWVAAAGCDTDSFAPPAPARPRASSATAPARAKEVVLILPAGDNGDLALYDAVGRNQAGFMTIVFRTLRPGSGERGKQAELIKQAVAEGASALIVVPDDTKETADALAALDPARTPVVLLGRTPTGPTPAGASIVAFEPFAASAKRMAEAVKDDLKTIAASPDAAVLMVVRKDPDESSAERDAALADALKAADLKVAATVKVGVDSAEVQKAVEAALLEHPEVWVVVADDEMGISAGNTARRAVGGKRYLVAGYYSIRNSLQGLMNGQVAGLADRNVEALARRAVEVAVARARGTAEAAKVPIPVEFRRGNATATASGSASPVPRSPLLDTDQLLAPPAQPAGAATKTDPKKEP